ncbi:MAG: hypothetical protein AB7E80_05780 [Hyphomicrobiaceae bacterium]
MVKAGGKAARPAPPKFDCGRMWMASGAKSGKTGSGGARAGGRARAGKSGGSTAGGNPAQTALEAECAALRAALAASEAEVARLRKRQELVVNRIDWVIDSLHNLMDDEG